jgi:serine/threonine-protein kinase
MSLQLLVVAGPDLGRLFPLTPGVTLQLGRGKSSETNLTDKFASKVHCQVQWEGEQPILVDQGSTGGTFVNGVRVSREALQPGAVIRIGQTQLRFQGAEGEDSALDKTLGSGMVLGKTAEPAVVEPPLELIGKALSHYAVGQVLARGQNGVIFRAQDTRDQREVALKVLLPHFSRDDAAVQRLVRAMKTMRPLRHPNLVTIYGAGKTDAYCWVAMELVVGEDLARLLQRTGKEGKLDWRLALRVAIHVGRALEYAHGHGIVHRNITPENVLLTAQDQTAKLGDLVLAKALEGMLAENITRPGESVGNVYYMSPERAAGRAEVDGRSDLYSLGALIYALLAGRPPLQGAAVGETLALIQEGEPAPLATLQPELPPDLAAAVHRLLQKRPEDRFQSATEMLCELERIAT